MKKRENTLIPRNPYVAAAMCRKAGAHDKRYKVKRRDHRQLLKTVLKQDLENAKGGDIPPFLMRYIQRNQ